MTSIINGIYENSLKQNVVNFLAIGGGIYILKSSYNFITNYFKEKNENKEIKILIEKEKSKINTDLSLSQNQNYNKKNEIVFSLYFKILNTVYKKNFSTFNKKRLIIFNNDDIEKYINYVEEFLKNLKYVEENILRIIHEELKLDPESNDLKYDKINIR
jgi:hypothetical protein